MGLESRVVLAILTHASVTKVLILRKRNAKSQMACLKRPYKQLRKEAKEREKGKIYPSECRVPKKSKER